MDYYTNLISTHINSGLNISLSAKSKLIDEYLIPKACDKQKNAEVSTPYILRQQMLDKIPSIFWTQINTVFEPCCGKGGFLIDIIRRFMTGLAAFIPDESLRYKIIIENCLYFADINPINIEVCKLILDPNTGKDESFPKYRLNSYLGDTLLSKWPARFDAVIGNPPYNSSGCHNNGSTVWQRFTKAAINEWVKPGGYLCFVHPTGWRAPCSKLGRSYGMYKLMCQDNHMIYLSIHGKKDGLRTFKCGTRYDWYVLKKKSADSFASYKTTINDQLGHVCYINTAKLEWLPNYRIKETIRLLAKPGEDRCALMYDRTSYDAKAKHMSPVLDDIFEYPCIHSTPAAGVRYMYSSTNDKGHFGIPKVIFGETGVANTVLDSEGIYGFTNGCMAIQLDDSYSDQDKLNFIAFMKGPIMADIIKRISYSNFSINQFALRYFKKEFWKLS